MINTILSFGLFLTPQAFAQTPPYVLEEASNSDYVHVSFDQILRRVGDQKKLIPSYMCDGVKENALFPVDPVNNPKANSLRVSTTTDNGVDFIFTYKNGQFCDENENCSPSLFSNFGMAVKKALEKLESLPSGRELLQKLETSPYPLTIKEGQNRFAPNGPDGRPYGGIIQASAILYFYTLFYPESYDMLNQIGNGGVIYFKPNGNYTRIESDNKVRVAPPYVTLAHEMFHAYDSVRGLLDRRGVNGKEYEDTEACEYRAVYLENKIRHESGIRYAKYYSITDPAEAAGAPGMLSPSGKPYFIPAICLSKESVRSSQ